MATTVMRPRDKGDDAVRWTPGELTARLAPHIPGSTAWGWLGPLAITAAAGVLRFWHLGDPHAVVFDETYYAKDSLSLLEYGVEHEYAGKSEDVNKQLLAGDTDIFKPTGSFIVHPQVGKWMIAAGYWIAALVRWAFAGQALDWHDGVTPLGWRVSAAIVGTLAVLVLARAARRMTRSTLLGCLAGLLLALDGLEFVQSRIALLDIFLMFWLVAAFACLVVDRDRSRARLARLVEERGAGAYGPWLGLRGWRIAAGVCLGLAAGSKWTGLWYIAAFGLLTLCWDVGARRAAGVHRPFRAALRLDAAPAFASVALLSAVVYVGSWASWFATDTGWDRHWAGDSGVLNALRGWWHYQVEIYDFHVNLDTHHDYQSSPWSWLLLIRPVAYYYTSPSGCGTDSCSSAITGIGTPAIWWASIPALLAMIWLWLQRRDWRAAAVLVGALVGWVPWLQYPDRTMFYFYALPMLPFIVLALTLVAGWVLGPGVQPLPVAARTGRHDVGGGSRPLAAPGNRRVAGAFAVVAFTLVVIVNFWYFLPILTAQVIPYSSWAARMWLRTWI